MKNKQYSLSGMKHKLFQMRNAGKKNPIWKLNDEQVEYLARVGFEIVPKVYRIKTRSFINVKNMNGLLKEVHYSRVKDHKNVIFKQLSPKQVRILEEANVKVSPYRYEIKLR